MEYAGVEHTMISGMPLIKKWNAAEPVSSHQDVSQEGLDDECADTFPSRLRDGDDIVYTATPAPRYTEPATTGSPSSRPR